MNQAEIDAVLHQIKILSGVEFRSIGVISPFRAQVDALTEAILAEWEPDAMARRKLEVGTVHAFQGAEFDAVVASWVLDQDSAPQTWSFLNDPNLFNVMITRARKKMIVFTSHPEPPGLAGQYVNHGLEPPRRDQDHPPPESPDRFSTVTSSAQSWINQVADALIDAGYTVEVGYQVGPFAVDVVVRNLAKPVAVICWPAVEGDEHHRQREQVLRRLGWQVLDAFESRWHDHVGHYAVEFSDKVGPMRPHVKESPS